MAVPGVQQGAASLPAQREGSGDTLPAAAPQQTVAAPAAPASDAAADTEVLLVQAWGSEIAIGLSRVARVAQLPAITPIPGDRPSRVGVVRFEERTIPVDDLGMLLGISPAGRYTLNHTLVVLQSGGDLAGIIVEPEVELLGDVGQSELTALPADHPAPLAQVLSRGTRHVPVLDVDRVVASAHGQPV